MENKVKVTVKDMEEKALETLKCPLCESKEFSCNENITARFPINAMYQSVPGKIFGVLEFICTECGNVISLSADFLAAKVVESNNENLKSE
ncbi:hypothetical protein [Clostridium cellulovorans]|uniref:Transcription initiation factor TFIIIB n=1 Tax=Clostridium cellulovorans (strain ATCC 35296 / DSM 3052 / OCM 3 / 743B) TaxID=573061 RepID=D9SM06_CLOC7|nr:hypothetical protein [Clostridium cellulovorans]ADL51737.1 hypothetical protein Clocel_1993 [Clostridium cellulovorans 743B]